MVRVYAPLMSNMLAAVTPSTPDQLWQKTILLVLAYVALSFFINPDSPFLSGHLTDPDDYARFAQVFAWLDHPAGLWGGWHDTMQPRLNPGENFVMPWSRLVDLPLALGVTLLEPVFGDRVGAALFTAFLVPMLMLVILLWLWPQLARPLIGKKYLWLGAALAPFFMSTVREFLPMRVDHHAWQLLLAAGGMACLLRGLLLRHPGWMVGCAGCYALGLTVGAEAQLWTLAAVTWIGLVAAWRGGVYPRLAAVFAIVLTLAIALLLPVARSWDEIWVQQLYQLSAAQLIFAALTAAMFLLFLPLAQRIHTSLARLGVLSVLAALAGAAFFACVPLALGGVYAEILPDNKTYILDSVMEAEPLLYKLRNMQANVMSVAAHLPLIAYTMFWPPLAMAIAGAQIWYSRGQRRQLIWLTFGFFLFIAMALSYVWQARVGIFAQLYAMPVILWFLVDGWRRYAEHFAGAKKFRKQLWLLLWLGPLPIVIIPAIGDGRALMPDTLFYLAERTQKPCDLRPIAALLNDPKGLGATPQRIIAPLTNGSELLFRTRHSAYSAPYNTAGNRFVDDFFKSIDDSKAQTLATTHGATMVLVCLPQAYSYWAKGESAMAELAAGALTTAGQEIPAAVQAKRQILGRLLFRTPPPWLELVPLPFKTDYVLYKIKE
jgi:hypothetical protein